jgi:deoxyribose-phosphate aldolase
VSRDLDRLAARVAEELAKRDGASPRGARPGATESGGSRSTKTERAPDQERAGRGRSAAGEAPPGVAFVRDQVRIADFIDHTLLKPEATRAEIEKLCDEASTHRFAAVCVNPVWVPLCAQRLRGTTVQVATVIGFPLGANQPDTKAAEAALAVRDGAQELDMVAALGMIKTGDWDHVARDIAAVVRAAAGNLVKVIIESSLLTPTEIIKASAIAKESGAQYVKTSTGFHASGGATPEAVALMRLAVGDALGVKASGGVRDCTAALRMIASGATRIGTSGGVALTECLGAGPLPLRELLSVANGSHAAHCASGRCSAPAAPGGAQPY